MPEQDFQRGEAAADLKNIKREVVEIKTTMKNHNDSDKEEFSRLNKKVDEVKDAAHEAADLARVAARDLHQEQEINDGRHEENKESLLSIKTTVENLAEDQASTKAAVAKIYIIAGALGSVGGLVVPKVISYFWG